jgi:hypothetical protein
VQGCGARDIEVFGALQHHDEGFFAVVAVNWNDDEPHVLSMDFVEIGAAESAESECSVIDLWSNTHIGTYKGRYMDPVAIQPHDNRSLKIKCSPPKQTAEL